MRITEAQFNTAQKTLSERSLSGAHKESMVSAIYTEAGKPPVPVVSPLSTYFRLYQQRMIGSFAVILLLVTGTSYASASSLPGDAFYAIKVRVFEPIGLATSFTDESKNEYRISLLQKRIEELQVLKKKSVVTASSQEKSAEATHRTIVDLERNNEQGGTVDVARVAEKVRDYNTLVDSELSISTALSVTASEPMEGEDTQVASTTPKDNHGEKEVKKSEKDSEISSEKETTQTVPVPQTLRGFLGL